MKNKFVMDNGFFFFSLFYMGIFLLLLVTTITGAFISLLIVTLFCIFRTRYYERKLKNRTDTN